jgi:hypothetical protein
MSGGYDDAASALLIIARLASTNFIETIMCCCEGCASMFEELICYQHVPAVALLCTFSINSSCDVTTGYNPCLPRCYRLGIYVGVHIEQSRHDQPVAGPGHIVQRSKTR